ncbi:unnamed protein product [Calypogeia fissa]
MVACVEHRFGILVAFTSIFVVIFCLLFPIVSVEAQQQQNFSSNPNDYDFGWFTTGIYAPGRVPYCTYCVNALDPNYSVSAADAAHGPYWNRTVGLYRCDGVQTNEMWAYDISTSSIVFSNLSTVLCVDALLWDSMRLLKLRNCNSSVVTQQWKRDGNQVVMTGLSDPNGALYLGAESPNKGTNPSNTAYNYPLVISASIPTDLGSSYSYTTNFTFLSMKNLVDESTHTFSTEGLLQISNSSTDGIVNGGFESSTIQAGTDISPSTYIQNQPSYLALCGWVIDYGPIDYVKSGLLQAANGSLYSVHLNTYTDTSHWGSVSQTFITEVGRDYVLQFFLNGFPRRLTSIRNCSSSYAAAVVQLGVTNSTTSDISSGALSDGNGFTQNFTFDVTNSDASKFGNLWTLKIVMFTASTNVTTLSFSSLNYNDACGPMIDEVNVSPLVGSAAKGKTLSAIAGSIAGLAIIIAILGIVYGVRYFKAKKEFSGMYKTEHARLYSVKELSAATKKFSQVLGEGAFGTVYKADFPDGTEGAVKVEKRKGLNSSSKVIASDEVAVLVRIHHRNLVNLIGFCIHKGRHMLVFECLPNGSLYDRLHQSILHSPTVALSIDSSSEPSRLSSTNILSWKQRVKIAADVANGLDYLHHDADPPIVHRDVKSQNILLTATDSAKLADFGLSKAAPADATSFQSIETMVRGSIGYLDPQYFLTGVFSAKSDVYSFGVVLLEIISGHQAIYNAAPLASWAAPYMTSPALYYELVDKKLKGEFDAIELESLVELSKMCMQEDSKVRPNMRQVVAFLNTRKLATFAEGVSEWMEETKAREAYHKMNPMFIDFQSGTEELVSSTDNFLSLASPQARD